MTYIMIITYTELRVQASAPAGRRALMSPSRYWSGFPSDHLVEILKTNYGFTHDQATGAIKEAKDNGRSQIAWEVDGQNISVAVKFITTPDA